MLIIYIYQNFNEGGYGGGVVVAQNHSSRCKQKISVIVHARIIAWQFKKKIKKTCLLSVGPSVAPSTIYQYLRRWQSRQTVWQDITSDYRSLLQVSTAVQLHTKWLTNPPLYYWNLPSRLHNTPAYC